jgi:hypothetical protein
MTRNIYFKDSIKEGDNAEILFKKIAIDKGFNHIPSSVNDNKYNHIDCFIKRSINQYSIDVKARKRKNRKDNKKFDDEIWIELKNIYGYDGWLYGKQDLIAFEQKSNFIVVNRLSLVEIVQQKISNAKSVSSPSHALYNLYTRSGRSDLLTVIKRDDLYKANYKIWEIK